MILESEGTYVGRLALQPSIDLKKSNKIRGVDKEKRVNMFESEKTVVL